MTIFLSQFHFLPYSSSLILARDFLVPLPPLDDLRQRPGRQPVHSAHDLERGPRLVVLVQQLAPEAVHHGQLRGWGRKEKEHVESWFFVCCIRSGSKHLERPVESKFQESPCNDFTTSNHSSNEAFLYCDWNWPPPIRQEGLVGSGEKYFLEGCLTSFAGFTQPSHFCQ